MPGTEVVGAIIVAGQGAPFSRTFGKLPNQVPPRAGPRRRGFFHQGENRSCRNRRRSFSLVVMLLKKTLRLKVCSQGALSLLRRKVLEHLGSLLADDRLDESKRMRCRIARMPHRFNESRNPRLIRLRSDGETRPREQNDPCSRLGDTGDLREDGLNFRKLLGSHGFQVQRVKIEVALPGRPECFGACSPN